jgi:hypothetical protein
MREVVVRSTGQVRFEANVYSVPIRAYPVRLSPPRAPG